MQRDRLFLISLIRILSEEPSGLGIIIPGPQVVQPAPTVVLLPSKQKTRPTHAARTAIALVKVTVRYPASRIRQRSGAAQAIVEVVVDPAALAQTLPVQPIVIPGDTRPRLLLDDLGIAGIRVHQVSRQRSSDRLAQAIALPIVAETGRSHALEVVLEVVAEARAVAGGQVAVGVVAIGDRSGPTDIGEPIRRVVSVG